MFLRIYQWRHKISHCLNWRIVATLIVCEILKLINIPILVCLIVTILILWTSKVIILNIFLFSMVCLFVLIFGVKMLINIYQFLQDAKMTTKGMNMFNYNTRAKYKYLIYYGNCFYHCSYMWPQLWHNWFFVFAYINSIFSKLFIFIWL